MGWLRTARAYRTLFALALVSCAAQGHEPSITSLPAGAAPAPTSAAAKVPELAKASPPAPVASAPRPGERLTLPVDKQVLELGPGRWVVEVAAPGEHFVTVGIAGRADAALAFEVAPPDALHRLRSGALDDDGRLPQFLSFETPAGNHDVLVIVDVAAPVKLIRSAVPIAQVARPSARDLKLGTAAPRPLVGLPFPIEARAGYVMQAPHRYQFVRADIARALRVAFRQTRVRFRRNLIGVWDASQWNGERPTLDMGKARHISHYRGRDVDIALPTRGDGPDTVGKRCRGVLVDERELRCAPGTVDPNFDAERLAYLLGLLIDGPTPGGRHVARADQRAGPTTMIETIYTDQVYIDEIRKALDKLRRKRWIHEEAYGALGEDGLLRASAYHIDHVHIRFAGEPAAVPEVLGFDAEPRPNQPAPRGEQAGPAGRAVRR
jgi:hypothetical protein